MKNLLTLTVVIFFCFFQKSLNCQTNSEVWPIGFEPKCMLFESEITKLYETIKIKPYNRTRTYCIPKGDFNIVVPGKTLDSTGLKIRPYTGFYDSDFWSRLNYKKKYNYSFYEYMIVDSLNRFQRYFGGEYKNLQGLKYSCQYPLHNLIVPDGMGTYIDQSGEIFVGNFNDGVLDGDVILYYNLNDKRKMLIGKYNDRRLNGECVLYYKDGSIFDCIATNGKISNERLRGNKFETTHIDSVSVFQFGDMKFRFDPYKVFGSLGFKCLITNGYYRNYYRYEVHSHNGEICVKKGLGKNSSSDDLIYHSSIKSDFFTNKISIDYVTTCLVIDGRFHGMFVSPSLCGLYVYGKKEGWWSRRKLTSKNPWTDYFFPKDKVEYDQNEYVAYFLDDINITGWKYKGTESVVTDNPLYTFGSTLSSSSSSDDNNSGDQSSTSTDYENINHPGIKSESNWQERNTLFDNKHYARTVKFKDGIYGELYRGGSSGEFFIEDLGKNHYYINYNATVRALYIYKKYGVIIDRDYKK